MSVFKALSRAASLASAGIFFLGGFPSVRADQVNLGTTVTFSVTVDGSAPFSYQWRKEGTNLSGATAGTYRISSTKATDAGSYTVVVSNAAGSTTSPAATLTVQPATTPVVAITIQTTNQIVTAGHAVSFTATGAADGGQWQGSTDGGSTWGNLPAGSAYRGVNTATLEITGVTSVMTNNCYRYVADGRTSNAAVLTVAPAFFPFPVGIAADPSGNLYVSDTASDTLQKISANGAVSLLAGSAGQTGTADASGASARFNDPAGIAAAADGVLSVADGANGTIRRITPAGAVTTLAGSTTARGNADGTGPAATFSAPLGVAQDGSGNLYVADALNHTIRKISASGTVSTLAGTAGAAGSADGTGAAARFNHPTGIAADNTGNVYVADATNNTIRKISATGAVTTLAGLAGVSGAQDGTGNGALFNHPGGLATDSAGNLYAADTGNSTIRKITPAGAVTTLAGLPGIAGLLDGTGGSAWFNQPQGLVVDSAGILYVTDTGNAAIRKVTPAGAVTTLALSSGSSAADTGSTTTATPSATSTATPAVTSSASSASSSGGGGAMDAWFAVALGLAGLVRRFRVRRGNRVRPGQDSPEDNRRRAVIVN